MKHGKIKASLIVDRRFWIKLKIIASDKDLGRNDLVVKALHDKFDSIEVTV